MTTIPTNPSPDGFISFPITVDANQLLSQAIQSIQAKIPGWVPAEGNLETVLLEEAAQMMSQVGAVASQVPMSIFIAFGQLVGINPNPGLAATVNVTITMIDNAGYTIPQGLQLSFPLSGNTNVLFITNVPLVIPPGSTSGTTELICTEVGSFPNGLASGTTLPLQQTFFGIASVVTTTVVSGGEDPDTITSYINRLSDELQLMSPRPILPNDFADLASNVNGVYRACAINGLSAGRSVIDGTTTSGSLTIGSATANWTTADIGRTVHDSLGYIPAGAAIASVLSPTQAVLGTSYPATGNAAANDVFTFGDLTNQERCITICGVNSSGQALSPTVQAAIVSYLDSLREVNFEVFSVSPTFTQIDVSVTCIAQAGASLTATQAAVLAAIQNFLNPATWGGGLLQPPEWNPTTTVSLLSLADTILSASGVAFIGMGQLEQCIHGGTLAAVDLALPGDAPLPQPGTITVVVNP